MELVNNLVNNQLALYIPVALALVGAVLVFAFGFKSAEQPPFEKIASIATDDRKTSGKKRKLKEKKPTLNGHIVNTETKSEKSSPSKETKKSKEAEQKRSETPKQEKKKTEASKHKKDVEVKKATKTKAVNEKPLDFDDGNWETVPTKGDKKKKQDSPVKKETNNKSRGKKGEKSVDIETLINKEGLEKKEQASEKKEQVPEKKEQISEKKEQVPEKKEQLPEKKEHVPEKKEQLPEKIEQALEKKELESEIKQVEVVTVEEKKEKKQEKKKKEEPKLEKVEAPKPAKINVPPLAEKVEVPLEKNEIIQKESSNGGVAFDELGDVWTEAKGQKKSKKKSRRDN